MQDIARRGCVPLSSLASSCLLVVLLVVVVDVVVAAKLDSWPLVLAGAILGGSAVIGTGDKNTEG